MVWLTWVIDDVPRILFDTGILALLLSGVEFLRQGRVTRAETNSRFTERHEHLWSHFHSRPELAGLLDPARDLIVHPLADEEVHFVNFLMNHLRDTFYAEVAGTYVQPVFIRQDIQAFMAYPATHSAWLKLKTFHDPKFVRFVDERAKPVTRATPDKSLKSKSYIRKIRGKLG